MSALRNPANTVDDILMWETNAWFRPGSWYSPPWLWYTASALLLVYGLGGIAYPPVGGAAGTLLALLGLMAVLWHGKGLRGSAPMWLLLLALGVQTLSWGLGRWHHPQWVADNPQLDRLAKLFIFISVAWWLGGNTRKTLLLWSCGLLGFLVASFTHGQGLQEWVSGLQGTRVGFGIRNLQHGSMLFGVALLGVVMFGPRFASSGGRWVIWRLAAWLAVLVLCLVGVVIGQTRAVWLSLLASLLVSGGVWCVWALAKGRALPRFKTCSMAGGVLLLVMVASGFAFHDTLKTRLLTESGVIAELAAGHFDAVPYTSVGIRIHSWQAALEWIAERPLVGWGGQGRGLVMEYTPWLPDFVKEEFGHLHNFFLEVWVAYGLFGVLLFVVLAVWIGRGTWLAWRAGVMPNDVALFGTAFFLYWVVINQFESYNSFGTGVYVHNLVVGGLVTHIWRWQWETGQRVFPALTPQRHP
ncbi:MULTISPECIES: O-antigen ligase family protein [Halomonas]|uniref:O-antigen ligase n=1 Tax=Halomonas ventosae TaxID=229007 RepID=A0A4R6I489_9GAMM|nr:O-antigen ligase family protein [Halomonas ventosae]TDO16830.1 O-antigen ligase [Halomonas ventosae]